MLELLPLDSFRAAFMGKPLGVPSNLLLYEGSPWLTHEALAIALIHDTPVRPRGIYTQKERRIFDAISSVWRALSEFDINDAKFVGYWENGDVRCGDADVKVSYWRKRDGRMLVVISNFGDAGQFALTFTTHRKLSRAYDALTDERIPLTNNRLIIAVERNNFRLIRIE